MENTNHIKKEKKLFNPLRLIVLLLIFLGLSFTSITLNLEAQFESNPFNDGGVYLLPLDTRAIRGVSADGEVCEFENESQTLTYFIPTRSQLEWNAVKTAAEGNHDHLVLVCCGDDCDSPCTPINCFNTSSLADLNNGRNCGSNLNNGCGSFISCGCLGANEVCTIEPGDDGFPEDLANLGEMGEQGYCRVDTGCNPVVYPSDHSEFGRLYCVDRASCDYQVGCDTAVNICATGATIIIGGDYLRIYNEGSETNTCRYNTNNGPLCSSYFNNFGGTANNYYAIFFHDWNEENTITTGNNYYVNMKGPSPTYRTILPCSAVPEPDPDPDPDLPEPSGTCTGSFGCHIYDNQTDCEASFGCTWEEDEVGR